MSDDLLEPFALERMVQAFADVPHAALVTSKRTPIDGNGDPLPDYAATSRLVEQDSVIDGFELGNLVLRRITNVIGEPTTVLVRREAFDLGLPWTVARRYYRVNSDVSVWLRLLATGPGVYLAEPCSRFRLHLGQDRIDLSRAVAEWWDLIEESLELGYLRPDGYEREAVARFVEGCDQVLAAPPGADHERLVRHRGLAVARLAQLDARAPGSGPVDPITTGQRAHALAAREGGTL
jgi:hypothetical protein